MTWTSLVSNGRPRDRYDVAAATFAVCLGVATILLTQFDKHNAGVSVASAIGVLFMTLPVAFARRRPLEVSAFLAVAATANGLIFGHVVRCGVTLPALFFVAYTVGSKLARPRSWIGLAFCIASVVAQCPYDPQLGWSAAPLIAGVAAAFFAGGCLVRSRSQLVDDLRRRNDELRDQRARTASMAVAADRAAVVSDLDDGLAAQLKTLADRTATGRNSVGTAEAADALAAIEATGRSALRSMRQVVGGLRDSEGTDPAPTLSDLPARVRRATSADVRVTVDGDAALLPVGVEVSVCRIVEHAVELIFDEPSARAEVRLTIVATDAAVVIDGPLSPAADAETAIARIQARVALHEGSLEMVARDGVCHVVAQLPISVGAV